MRNEKIISTLLLICFYISLVSQGSYIVPDKIPDNYLTNTKTEYDNFIANHSKNKDTLLFKYFAERLVYEKQSSMLNGNIYYNFNNYENYLNGILTKLLDSGKIANKQNFKVYLRYDDSYNAFAMADGTIFVNIGLMAACRNEASLACILAHEITHVVYEDNYRDYKKNAKVDWRNVTSKELNKIILNLKYSREAELRADSFGFYLAMNAGFDIREGFSNYDYLYRHELRKYLYDKVLVSAELPDSVRFLPISLLVKNGVNMDEAKEIISDKKASREKKEKNMSTHPEIIDRVLLLYRIISENDKELAKIKNSNTSMFNQLQFTAKDEVLRLLLHEHEYKDCIEQAFIFYLSDTSNKAYLYYELESIRRYLVSDSAKIKTGFLNYRLKKIISAKESILHLPLYLIPDSTILLTLQGIRYFDDSYEFETYKQAFVYFLKLTDANVNPEINLTAGMFFKSFGLQKADSLLKKYISDERALYPDYAKNLLEGTLLSSLEKNKRDIIFCSDINSYQGTRKAFRPDYISTDTFTSNFIKDFRTFKMVKRSDCELFFRKDQTSTDFNFFLSGESIIESLYFNIDHPEINIPGEYRDIYGEDSSAPKRRIVKYEKNYFSTYLYTLEPESWNFIKENRIKSISEFYARQLYDHKLITSDAIDNAAGIIIPGILLFKSNAGSSVHTNRTVYLNFQTSQTNKPLMLQFEDGRDKFSRMDYVNVLYFKIMTEY